MFQIETLFQVLGLGLLIWMIVDDWLHREVHLLAIIPFTGLSIVWHFWIGVEFWVIVNVTLILILLLTIAIYYSIKNRSLNRQILSYFGLGDILCLVAISWLVNPVVFLAILIVSALSAILVFAILKLLAKKSQTIPFVSYLGMVLTAFWITAAFHQIPSLRDLLSWVEILPTA